MMKILFISADNIYLTPYLNKYISRFSNGKNSIQVFYWDKNNNEHSLPSNYIRFYEKNKILGYIKFKIRIIKYLKSNSFDLIIPLHQIVFLLINNYLINNYKNKYIFDVRDYSYEKFGFVRKIQKKLVRNSRLNIISSEGYKNFLPNAKYFVTHNVPSINVDNIDNNNKNSPIRIGYIGLIRFMEQNKKIIDFFKNDDRFFLYFIGTNALKLKEYCIENDIKNVELIDTFDPKDTMKFYQQIDIIMNLYGNNTPLLDYAISNKFYYALLLKKPILVCKDTFMEKVALEAKIGFVLNLQKNSERDDLYNYYNSLDYEELKLSCDNYLKKVYDDEKKLDEEFNIIQNEKGCD